MAQTLVSTIGGVPGTGAIVAVTAGTTTVSNPTSLIFTGASVSASGSAALVAITASTGGGAGTVTSLTAGSGITLSPSTITSAGSIAVQTTGVTAGTYSNANITVNAQGQVTAASSGSGGGLVWLSTFTASGALTELDITGFISATYDTYYFVLNGVTLQTSTADLRMQIGTGASPTYDTGNNYEWVQIGLTTGAGALNAAGSAVGFCRLFGSVGVTAGFNGNATFTWHGFNSTSLRKNYHGTGSYENSTPAKVIATLGGDWLTSGTAVSAVRLITSSGSITAGTVYVYGMQKS